MPLTVREEVRRPAGSELDSVSAHADVDIEQAFNQLQGKVISLEHNKYFVRESWNISARLWSVSMQDFILGEYDNIDNSIKLRL